jgi:ATP-dependent DNA helicase RecQ
MDVPPYNLRVSEAERSNIEKRLREGDLRWVATTSALRSFYRRDIQCVVHYQSPGSIKVYFDQICQAGRNGQQALAMLMTGAEDDRIHESFKHYEHPGKEDHESTRVQELVATDQCLMQFILRELGVAGATRCGQCANCVGSNVIPRRIDLALLEAANKFIGPGWMRFAPIERLPAGAKSERRNRQFPADLVVELGLALSAYWDPSLGALVRRGKYEDYGFDMKLMNAAVEAISATWKVDAVNWWMTAVPSLHSKHLVKGFAFRLAERLGIPFDPALIKTKQTRRQKLMQDNSPQQFENLEGVFKADDSRVRKGPVILVDDIIDSGWTMTLCGEQLRLAGSGRVYPFALASLKCGV